MKFGERDSKDNKIQVISAADGSVRTLKTLQGAQPTVRISPDGQWVAVSHRVSRMNCTRSR